MVSRAALSFGTAGVAIYFAVLGFQGGLLVLCSVTSFLIGGHIGCSSTRFSTLALILSVVVLLNTCHINADECSREKSRQARMIIDRQVKPRYLMWHYPMPVSCPLSPANDQYAAQEVMKRKFGNDWMCSVCGKIFKKEEELESHLVDNHKVHKVEACLADNCDVLRCGPFFDTAKEQTACDDNEMAVLKQQCMDMVRNLCSPEHANPTERLQVEVAVQASLCSYLTCADYWTIPEKDTSSTQYYYTVYSVAFVLLLVLLAIYFKIASDNIDSSVSVEKILASSEQFERPKPAIIPPDPDMEIRHRTGNIDRQWSENE